MAVTITVPPTATKLTTFERVATEFGIEHVDGATKLILTGMIADASSAIAFECGWPFGAATYVETLAGTDSHLLGLSRPPIVSVSEVLEDSNPITDYTIEWDYVTMALRRNHGWRKDHGLLAWGWESYASQYILHGDSARLRYQVTYIGGYTLPTHFPSATPDPGDPPALPGAVERACIGAVRAWWFDRDRDNSIASARDNNVQVAFRSTPTQTRALPDEVIGLLRDYRRVL